MLTDISQICSINRLSVKILFRQAKYLKFSAKHKKCTKIPKTKNFELDAPRVFIARFSSSIYELCFGLRKIRFRPALYKIKQNNFTAILIHIVYSQTNFQFVYVMTNLCMQNAKYLVKCSIIVNCLNRRLNKYFGKNQKNLVFFLLLFVDNVHNVNSMDIFIKWASFKVQCFVIFRNFPPKIITFIPRGDIIVTHG